MDWRTKKQLTILAGVFFAFFIVLFAIALSVFYSPGSCADNKKNQSEEDVDCGGPCTPCAFKQLRPVEVFFARFIEVRQGNFDIVAEIRNPNEHLAGNPLVYRARLYDDKNAEVGRRENITYIDPNDRIYIIESNFLTERNVARAVVEILDDETKWEYTNELRPDITIGRKNYEVVAVDGRETSRVMAELANHSAFAYRYVEARAALLDADGNIVGVARTIVQNVRPGEPRPIEFSWPNKIETGISRIDIEARTNWLDPSNIVAP